MTISIAKSVNFGSTKTGLATVGYAYKNPDGSIKQARTIVGITEVASGQGIYGGVLTFEVGWSGFIIWDTGDSDVYYAVENFDYRQFQGAGGGVALHIDPRKKDVTVWKPTDKKRIMRNLKKIMEDLQVSAGKADAFTEMIKNIREKDLKTLIERKNDVSLIEEALQNLSESVSKLNRNDIGFNEAATNLTHLKILVESQNKFFEPIIDGISTLIESESIKSIEREISR